MESERAGLSVDGVTATGRNLRRRESETVMKKRILVAGLFHETHTFVEERTGLEQFGIRSGSDLLSARGDGSPVDGVLAVADESGWDVVPTVDMRAAPGGTVTDEAVACFFSEFGRRAKPALRDGVDGVFLVLHGAMVSDSRDDVEGDVLRHIRELSGAERIPVFGVYDLHANFSPAMARWADCLLAYRENPHTDARQTAVEAARLLDRCLSGGGVPRSRYRHASILWPPTGTGTAADPMRALEAAARRFERDGSGIWAVNVNAGFSFADTPAAGVSFCVSGTCSDGEAEAVLERLRRLAWELRAAGCTTEPPVDEVLPGLLPVGDGPVVLIEPSDNIGGGAPGDGTGLLRAFLAHRVEGAVVVINDPASVTAAVAAGTGRSVSLSVGGRGSRMDPGPVALEVEVLSSSDGVFDLEDPRSHLASMRGRRIDMGPCAVVRHAGVTILLTSRRTPPFDLGQLRSQGIEPEKAKLIGVKAAVAHRRAYDPIAKAMVWVDTPGPCSSRLDRFPYQRLKRPVYPLDDCFQPF